MGRSISLNEMQTYLETAKQNLSAERADLLTLCPLDGDLNREAYAFAYVRAERMGMRAINRRLGDVAWLPMQLDPKSEIMGDNRAALKRWLTAAAPAHPNANAFGNDFIHVLTRCGMEYGWDTPAFFKSAIRIANLFRDLSCLIGLIYYGTWLNEHDIESLRLTDPTNLYRTAEEVTLLIKSPEMQRLLKARAQRARAVERKMLLAQEQKKKRPDLKLIISNSQIPVGGFMPEPVGV